MPLRNHAKQQYIFDFPKREKLSKDVFIVGDCNYAAYEILQKYPDWQTPFLTLYGLSKSGKTHLAQIWTHQVGARKITLDDITAIRKQDSVAIFWLDLKEGHDVLAKNFTLQEALCNLYNDMVAGGGGLLITALEPPHQWQIPLDDLRSRLKGIPAIRLGAPDDLLLENLLKKLSADRQMIIDDAVIQFLLKRMERSFEAAYLLAEKLDKLTLQKKKPITIALAKQCLIEQ